MSGWGGESFSAPKKRAPECYWCGSRAHKTEACPEGEQKAALRERIAERQAHPWEPREVSRAR